MDCKIAEKPAFTVAGITRSFNSETSYREIPEYWEEIMSKGADSGLTGMYGVCFNQKGDAFDYMIADNYIPQKPLPDGFTTVTLPAGLYALFPCKGRLPEALQSVNTSIWNEWLPNCKDYRLRDNFDIEVYFSSLYSEIWVPVEKTKQ